MLSELDLDYIWIGIWSVGIAVSTEQLDSSCKTEQCLVSKPSVWLWNMIWMWFDCVLDFRFLVFSSYLYSGSGNLYVISGNLYMGIDVLYCPDQSVHLVQLGHSASIYGSSLVWHFYIPASSLYCIFQLQVQLYFHFQLDFLLPVLVLTRAHQTCSVLARDAMLYYIVLEYSMYSIWIVLTITLLQGAFRTVTCNDHPSASLGWSHYN